MATRRKKRCWFARTFLPKPKRKTAKRRAPKKKAWSQLSLHEQEDRLLAKALRIPLAEVSASRKPGWKPGPATMRARRR